MKKRHKYPLKMTRPSDPYNPNERWGTPGLFKKKHPHFREASMITAYSRYEKCLAEKFGYKVLKQ